MTLQKLAAFSLALGLAVPTVVEGSEISHSDWSVGTPLDTRGLDGTRLAAAEERIAYDPQWGNAESCSLDANGTRILSGGEAGVVPWSPTGPGLYRLTHTAGNVTYTARFAVPGPETTVVEADRLETNAVWHTGGVYLVTGTVTVPGGVTLTIESGAIVKFMPGARLAVEAGATCLARGVVFTHAYDDAAGGDTLFDGAETTPVVNDYELTGTITDDETTEYRYTAPLVLSGTISSNMRWRGWKLYHVTGDLTVASGVTLTIEPGAVVKFDAGRSLTVAGGATLDAQGTRAQPIVFTSIKDDGHGGDTNGDGDKTQPQPGDWARINANGTVKMNHCRLYYCSDTGDRGAIQGGGGTVTFDNGEIAHTTYECVRMNSGTFVSHNSVFRDSSMGFGYFGGSGTYVYNGVVADCTIACRASNKHFVNTVFYNCLTFLESTSSSADHCAFYNPPDWGAQTATQVGKNGNIWGDPLFVDPANGDFRIREGSPCVDAADSSAAPELDYFGQPRITFTGRTNDTELAKGPLADIGICEVMPRDVTSDIDLVPEAVRTEKTATPGQLLFVKWEVRNQGGASVDATWRDTVSLVSADGREVVLGDKTTKSAIAVGGSVFCSGYFTVPAMAEGTWYPKVNVNSYHDIFEGSLTANNALLGAGGVEVAVKEVESEGEEGVVNAGAPTVKKITLPETGGNRMVRIKVPAGVTIRWGFGFVPTGNQKSGTLTSNGQDVLFRVPDGVTDVYVSMESDGGAEYDLSLEEGQVVITGVSPNTLPSSGEVTITIDGAGFTEDSKVYLVKGTTQIAPKSVQYVSAQKFVATVDCGKLTAGTQYDVSVVGAGNTATEVNVVNVAEVEGNGEFWLKFDAPESVRAGRTFLAVVSYGNNGNANIGAELIRVVANGGSTIKSKGSGKWVTELILPAVGDLDHQEVILPGESHSVAIECKASSVNEIRVYTTRDSEFDGSPWASADEFLSSLRIALAYLSRLHVNGTGYERVYDVAVGMRNAARNHLGGVVANLQGSMVSDVSLQLHRVTDDGEELLDVARSDEDGRFAFLNVPDGVYRIRSDCTISRVIRNGNVLHDSFLSVSNGVVDGDLRIVISEFHNLELFVGEAENNDILVSVWRLDDGESSQFPVRWDGLSSCYVVTGVETSGLYVVTAKGTGRSGQSVVLLDPSITSVSYLSLKPPVTVRGTLSQLRDSVTPDGEEPYVLLRSLTTMRAYVCNLDEDGVFRFDGVPAAEYTLAVGGVTRSYEFDAVYDFTAGGEFVVDSVPVSPDKAVTVRFPSGWSERYAIVLADSAGVVNCKPTSENGELTFASVADGCWMCRVIRIADGQVLRSLMLDTEESRTVDLTVQENSFSASVNKRVALKGGVWSDITDAIYSAWRAFRDWSADCIAGWNWANKVMGWFQSGSYNKGQKELERASTLFLTRTVKNPDDCDCGYNKAKHLRDVQSMQNFAGVFDDFSRYVSTLDNMKAVAMSFKSVGDTAEMFMRNKIKNGTGGLLSKIAKVKDLAGTIKSIKKSIKTWNLGANAFMFEEDIRSMFDFDEDRITSEISALADCITLNSDISSGIAHLAAIIDYARPFMKAKNRKLFSEAPDIAKFFDTVSELLQTATEILTIVEDVLISVKEWEKYANAVEDFDSKLSWFENEVDRYDVISARFNQYHTDECHQACPELPDPPEETYNPRVPQSIDPNEMAGPIGLGDPETERYMKPGEWMTYTVYFENRADATAAAQEVRVTNPLSEYLDWSTFEMGEVAFNNQIDLGLSGKRSGTSEAAMKGTNTLVRTQLTLDDETGTVEWYLRIVDPTTATGWPEDVFAGFLPPNDETFRGEGHLTYRVKVRDDAPHGVRIDNSASIVFDYNEPIETDPSWWNTVARTLEAGFAEMEVTVDEGGTATVTVRGGSAERATSVQVYLSYQTASAADLDLKNAAEDGTVPKGGLRFPLTLSWAAGEIGVKTLAIPVKTDRAVENEELFTLQLANAQGMGVGDASYCTVTVRDANAAADYAARQGKTTVRTKKGVPDCALSVACAARDGSGAVCGYTTGQGSYYAGCRASLRATARPGWAFAGWGEVVDGVTNVVGTKAGWTVTPTNDTEIVALFERIPYVRALADPADGGKVSGSGYCAAGKKVALKATASRNFTFAGWYAAGAPDAPVATTPTLVLDRSAKHAKGDARQTVLTDVDGDATYFARFVGDPEVSVAVSATDGRGAEPAGKGAGRYVAGTVTGAGRYAPGKKAVLKATANRGYVFAGWREAGADGTLSRSAAYTIGAMPPDDVALVAAFVTADEDRESVAASLGGLPLAPWVSKTETHALATNVRAGVYLEWPLAASALSETTVKVAGLPAGLRFAAKPVTSRSGTGRSAVLVTNVPANTVYGAPTAASRTVTDRRTGAVTVTPSAVKVTVTTAGRSSRTYQIDTTVDPLPAWAQGTFAGVSYADADGAETNGLAAVSVTAAGKVSARQTAAGRAASFTAPWYDRHDAAEDAYHATLTAKVGAAVVTNRVTVRAAAHAATDAVPAETALGVMRGDLLDAWQTDWRREPWKGFAAALARARPPLAYAYEVVGDQPGTVALKFGANGAVTAAGTFATGVDARGRETTAKASCSATLLPQGGDRYLVFVYFPPKGAFRGHARCLALAWDGAGFVEDVAW